MTRLELSRSTTGPISDIYFLGIAGLVMSSLACIAKAAGFRVSGSDEESAYPPATTALAQHQIDWAAGHKVENLGRPDLVVLGNHIRQSNPELQAALDRKLIVISYPELVAMMYADHEHRLVPAGAHGKSTLTALIGWILVEAGYDPTVLIGAASRNLAGGFRQGLAKILVIEGDEYSSSCLDKTSKFMYYRPSTAIITSAELDHVDLSPTLEKQVARYTSFGHSVSADGLVLMCTDSPSVALISRESRRSMPARVETYGLVNEPDWLATDLVLSSAESTFAIVHNRKRISDFRLTIPGAHNVQNATAAIAATLTMGVPLDRVKSALRTFMGVGRRFEVKAEIGDITIVDDFAHHPTAIRTTLSAARSRYGARRLWCIYEPHTYSRVRALLPLFAGAFGEADEVIVADIYAGREHSSVSLVDSNDIVDVVHKDLTNVRHIPTPDLILDYLSDHVRRHDVVVFMSVGRFGEVANRLVERLKEMECRGGAQMMGKTWPGWD
jgi:UDP-N-acetylmuramate: L-alanyl-gamma-D-glutamyl-meso-diaminopimelate ligase